MIQDIIRYPWIALFKDCYSGYFNWHELWSHRQLPGRRCAESEARRVRWPQREIGENRCSEHRCSVFIRSSCSHMQPMQPMQNPASPHSQSHSLLWTLETDPTARSPNELISSHWFMIFVSLILCFFSSIPRIFLTQFPPKEGLVVFSSLRKSYCCRYHHRGCVPQSTPAPYDCDAGVCTSETSENSEGMTCLIQLFNSLGCSLCKMCWATLNWSCTLSLITSEAKAPKKWT